MKRIVGRSFSIIKGHLMALIVVIIFRLSILAMIKNVPLLTIVYALICLSAVYFRAWDAGFRDSRKIGDYFPDIPGGVKTALLSCVLPALLLLVRVIAYYMCVGSGQDMTLFLRIMDVIYRVYFIYFLVSMQSGSLWVYILPILFQFAVCVLGYILGLKRFDLLSKYMPKIVYKKDKKIK